MKNFDYVCYATPNLAVIDALDDETLSDTTISRHRKHWITVPCTNSLMNPQLRFTAISGKN